MTGKERAACSSSRSPFAHTWWGFNYNLLLSAPGCLLLPSVACTLRAWPDTMLTPCWRRADTPPLLCAAGTCCSQACFPPS